jgi:hypothetical protein
VAPDADDDSDPVEEQTDLLTGIATSLVSIYKRLGLILTMLYIIAFVLLVLARKELSGFWNQLFG